MSVGMPKTLLLHDFGRKVEDAFRAIPYHVGTSLGSKTGWRDVDVRLILEDVDYDAWGFGDPCFPHENAKWVAFCLAFSLLGERMTGLPIDFQIQQRTWANRTFPCKDNKRSAIGILPIRRSL